MEGNRQGTDIQEYLIILHENQLAIKHLTQTVERLSIHVDKLVEKQIDMHIQHKDINIVKMI